MTTDASKLPIEILPLFQGGFEGKFDNSLPVNGQVDTVIGKAFLFQRQLAQEMDGQKTLVLDRRTVLGSQVVRDFHLHDLTHVGNPDEDRFLVPGELD